MPEYRAPQEYQPEDSGKMKGSGNAEATTAVVCNPHNIAWASIIPVYYGRAGTVRMAVQDVPGTTVVHYRTHRVLDTHIPGVNFVS